MIQPTGVEVVLDWAMIVVDLWVLAVVGVTSVGGTPVVVGAASVVGVVVVGSEVGVVVVVEGTVLLGTSVVSVGDVVVGLTAPVTGGDPLDAVVGVETEGGVTDGEVTVGLVALPLPPPQAARSPARTRSPAPNETRTCRPVPIRPLMPVLPVRVVTSLSSLCVGPRSVGSHHVPVTASNHRCLSDSSPRRGEWVPCAR
jgi:hypothetical protein